MLRDVCGISINSGGYYLSYIVEAIKTGRIGYDRDGMEILLNDRQLSKIIEAILIGIPLPSAYINTMSEEFHWEAITGHTVLEAVNRFIIKQDLVLEGLKLVPELNGLYFNDLSIHQRNIIFDTRWELIRLDKSTNSSFTKEMNSKVSFHIREDIFAIVKEFNAC